jgi:NADH-quinone oxidoreductase subunit M
LWSRLSTLPPVALFFTAASLGLPGLGNFVGEFLILLGAYKVAPLITIFASSGLVLAAIYSLIMMQRAFFGPAQSTERLPDLSIREISLMVTLMGILLYLGLYPQQVLNTSLAAMTHVQQIYAAAGQLATAGINP